MGVKATERVKLYSTRALSLSNGSNEQKKYAKLAIAELDALIDLNDEDKETELYLKLLFTKARMLSMADQPEERIKLTNKILLLNKNPGIFDPAKVESLNCYSSGSLRCAGQMERSRKDLQNIV